MTRSWGAGRSVPLLTEPVLRSRLISIGCRMPAPPAPCWPPGCPHSRGMASGTSPAPVGLWAMDLGRVFPGRALTRVGRTVRGEATGGVVGGGEGQAPVLSYWLRSFAGGVSPGCPLCPQFPGEGVPWGVRRRGADGENMRVQGRVSPDTGGGGAVPAEGTGRGGLGSLLEGAAWGLPRGQGWGREVGAGHGQARWAR